MVLYQAKTAPTSDGGYILTGCNNTPAQDWDIFLIKMDSNGDTMWTRTYQHPGAGLDDTGEDVIQTIDGGFFVVAFGFILKTDSLGQPMWAKGIASNWTAINRACTESPNGDIIIVSSAYDSSVPTSRIILTKLDSSGSLLFMKSFGNFPNPYPYSVKITNDGGYIIAGETAYASSNTDAILIKTDSMGNFTWAHQYGGNSYDVFRSVEQTANGDYLVLGNTSLNTGDFLVKVDSTGTLLWSRTYNSVGGNTCSFGMLTKTSNQNFVFCDDNANMGKMNSNGTILWAKSYMPGVSSSNKRFNSIKETGDGGLITSGYYSGGGFLYIVKSDSTGPNPCFASNVSFTQIPVLSKDSSIVCTVSTGSVYNVTVTPECFCDSSKFLCTGVGISENDSPNYTNVFPNPFCNKIEITNEKNESSEIILYDITARKILQQKFISSVSLNTEQLTKGIYLYEVRSGNRLCKKGKLVKD